MKNNYQLLTNVINKMNVPFTIRIAVKKQTAEVKNIFNKIIQDTKLWLETIDTEFSPFKSDSLVTKFRNGNKEIILQSDRFGEVYSLSSLAKDETEGFFNPFFDGGYNPTGLVKGWAIEKIFNQKLLLLLRQAEIVGVSLNGGGDIQTAVDPKSDFQWFVGIENPQKAETIIGQYALKNSGIATSGLSKRGEHIKRVNSSIQQVTVVADSLTEADVWATAGMAAGTDKFLQLIAKNQLSGILVDKKIGEVLFERGDVQDDQAS